MTYFTFALPVLVCGFAMIGSAICIRILAKKLDRIQSAKTSPRPPVFHFNCRSAVAPPHPECVHCGVPLAAPVGVICVCSACEYVLGMPVRERERILYAMELEIAEVSDQQ